MSTDDDDNKRVVQAYQSRREDYLSLAERLNVKRKTTYNIVRMGIEGNIESAREGQRTDLNHQHNKF